jgi:hypothetical protein
MAADASQLRQELTQASKRHVNFDAWLAAAKMNMSSPKRVVGREELAGESRYF